MLELFQQECLNILIDSNSSKIEEFKKTYHLKKCIYNDLSRPIDIIVINNTSLVNMHTVKTSSVNNAIRFHNSDALFKDDIRVDRWNQKILSLFINTPSPIKKSSIVENYINFLNTQHYLKNKMDYKDYVVVWNYDLKELNNNVLYTNEELNNIFSMVTCPEEKTFLLGIDCLKLNNRYATNLIITAVLYKFFTYGVFPTNPRRYRQNFDETSKSDKIKKIMFDNRHNLIDFIDCVFRRNSGWGRLAQHLIDFSRMLRGDFTKSSADAPGNINQYIFNLYHQLLSDIIQNDPIWNINHSINKQDYDFFTNPALVNKVYSPYKNILDLNSIKFKQVKQQEVNNGSTAGHEEFNL